MSSGILIALIFEHNLIGIFESMVVLAIFVGLGPAVMVRVLMGNENAGYG